MQKQVITMIFIISTFLLVFIAQIQCHFSVNFDGTQNLAGDNPGCKLILGACWKKTFNKLHV